MGIPCFLSCFFGGLGLSPVHCQERVCGFLHGSERRLCEIETRRIGHREEVGHGEWGLKVDVLIKNDDPVCGLVENRRRRQKPLDHAPFHPPRHANHSATQLIRESRQTTRLLLTRRRRRWVSEEDTVDASPRRHGVTDTTSILQRLAVATRPSCHHHIQSRHRSHNRPRHRRG